MDKPKNILIVGAGFSGATIAHLLAKQNYNVSIIESRDHSLHMAEEIQKITSSLGMPFIFKSSFIK